MKCPCFQVLVVPAVGGVFERVTQCEPLLLLGHFVRQMHIQNKTANSVLLFDAD